MHNFSQIEGKLWSVCVHVALCVCVHMVVCTEREGDHSNTYVLKELHTQPPVNGGVSRINSSSVRH